LSLSSVFAAKVFLSLPIPIFGQKWWRFLRFLNYFFLNFCPATFATLLGLRNAKSLWPVRSNFVFNVFNPWSRKTTQVLTNLKLIK
jgi:hypothetical protein